METARWGGEETDGKQRKVRAEWWRGGQQSGEGGVERGREIGGGGGDSKAGRVGRGRDRWEGEEGEAERGGAVRWGGEEMEE